MASITMTTTTTKNDYEFLPEIWQLIKEYAVPKKYEYDEEDCVYEVHIWRFLEMIEDGFDKEHYATTKMVVETNGDAEDTCITFRNATTDRYLADELLWTTDFQVNDGCCKPRFSNWLRAEFMLSDLMPEDLDDEWGTAWPDEVHYTDLQLVIELSERGNCKYLIDPEDPENPIHTYGYDL